VSRRNFSSQRDQVDRECFSIAHNVRRNFAIAVSADQRRRQTDSVVHIQVLQIARVIAESIVVIVNVQVRQGQVHVRS